MKQTVRNFSSTFVSVIIGLKASKLHRFVCLLWIQLGMQFVQWTTSTQINKLRFCLLCFLTWVLWKRSDLFGLVQNWKFTMTERSKIPDNNRNKEEEKNHSFSLLLHIQKKENRIFLQFYSVSVVCAYYLKGFQLRWQWKGSISERFNFNRKIMYPAKPNQTNRDFNA